MTFITLGRRFLPWHNVDSADPEAASYLQAAQGSLSWADLLNRKRVVILAEAGSGKTEELLEQARLHSSAGKFGFYATVESVGLRGLSDSLPRAEADQLRAWASSNEEAWFFIDSIDEAKVSDVRLEDALRQLAAAVHGSEVRAHIILSGRYTDWEFQRDLTRLATWLPLPLPDAPLPKLDADEELIRILDGEKTKEKPPEKELPTVVVMAALSPDQVRHFARSKGVCDVDGFVIALGQKNLLDFARRPLDLDWLTSYWNQHRSFGSLKDMLERSLRERLEEKDPQRARKDPLSSDRLMAGLERVGAALIMQRRQDVLVPDSALAGDLRLEAVDLTDVLPDWTAAQRMSLLGRSVFDPARSGLARLHNDNQGVVRAYLTARWLYGAYSPNCPLSEIRSLLFATTYGVEVVVPSMRLVAAWLALWLPEVANEIIRRDPHLLLSAGDPGSLPLETREQVLAAVVQQLLADSELPLPTRDGLSRFASPALSSSVRQLWNAYSNNAEVRELLLMIIWQGELTDCADIAVAASYGNYPDHLTQVFSGRGLLAVGNKDERARYLAFLEENSAEVPSTLIWDAAQTLLPTELSVSTLLKLLSKLKPEVDNIGHDLDYHGPQLVEKLDKVSDVEAFARGLFGWLRTKPDPLGSRVAEQDERLFPALRAAATRVLTLLPADQTSELAVDIALTIGRHGTRYSSPHGADQEADLGALLKQTPARRRSTLWRAAAQFNGAIGGRPVTELWQLNFLEFYPGLLPEDVDWLIEDARIRPDPAERSLAANATLEIWRSCGAPEDVLAKLKRSAANWPEVAEAIEVFLHPPAPTEEYLAYRERMRVRRDEDTATRAARDQDWKEFAARLRADPSRLSRSVEGADVNPDLFDFWKLLFRATKDRNRHSIADLSPLKPLFGSAVLDAARQALKSIWRRRDPKLSVDKPEAERNRWNQVDSMALVGLALESSDTEWAQKLSPQEAARATILATYEINELPPWIVSLANAHGQLVGRVLARQIGSELDGLLGTNSDRTLRLVIAAGPTVLELIAGDLLRRVAERQPIHEAALRSVIEALQQSRLSRTELSRLFAERLTEASTPTPAVEFAAGLFAIDESAAIACLYRKLRALLPEFHAPFVQGLLPRIVGGVFENGLSASFTLEQVEKLVQMAFAKIQIEADNKRAPDTVFSFNARDDAEVARGKVFQQLVSRPGPATYAAIQRLIAKGTLPVPRRRLEVLARARASEDSEFAAWSAEDVVRFEKHHHSRPRNPEDLFRLILRRLKDIQHDLLNADFGQPGALRQLPHEVDVQKWIAERLRLLQRDSYSVDREPHVAEEKEPDIRVRATAADANLPIEIKVAESWTLEELERALVVQLVNQYLRDRHNRFGILLLVHQNARPKGWQCKDGSWVDFQEVVRHLSCVAGSIAASGWGAPQPMVAKIDVSSVELKKERLARLAKKKAERPPRRSSPAKTTRARR